MRCCCCRRRASANVNKLGIKSIKPINMAYRGEEDDMACEEKPKAKQERERMKKQQVTL